LEICSPRAQQQKLSVPPQRAARIEANLEAPVFTRVFDRKMLFYLWKAST
jgi:hypothetical protein